MTPQCAAYDCDRPSPSAQICTACERKLMIALLIAAFRGPDLDDALAKRVVFGDRSHSTGHAAPLPYDPRVAEVADQLRGVLSSWVRDLTETSA